MITNELTQRMEQSRRILVVGASGGSGRATVEHLLRHGHHVTAFSRQACQQFTQTDRLTPLDGNVTNTADVDRAVRNHDAVIVTLGISENPLWVRLLGSKHTSADVRSRGTGNVISAMRQHKISRLVVQSSYGVGETRGLLGFVDQLFFSLLLKPQIEDTEVQENVVRASEMDWVIAQPVHLIDSTETSTKPYISISGETRAMKVARTSVADFLACASLQPDFIGKSVAVSG